MNQAIQKSMNKVLCISTAGKGQDPLRMRQLTQFINAEVTHYDLDRSLSKLAAARAVWKLVKSQQWNLIYQEGTGLAGGLSLIRAYRDWQQPFVVSSGDPIGGYFHTKFGPVAGSLFDKYERLLYESCAGFIGWTPYLTGAALKMGAKQAVTVEGAVDVKQFYPLDGEQKSALRSKLGIPKNHLVCGMAGSINWVSRQSWCQGYELVQMMKYLKRPDISVLIVGDGSGKAKLEALVPEHLKTRVIFTGRVPSEQVPELINSMDIGFVTQIMGRLGNFRLSTKLPEYLACGTAIAMSPIPGFFDYAYSAGWPLPGLHPASQEFHQQCAAWLDELSWEEINLKKSLAFDTAKKFFDYEVITPKFTAFIERILSS